MCVHPSSRLANHRAMRSIESAPDYVAPSNAAAGVSCSHRNFRLRCRCFVSGHCNLLHIQRLTSVLRVTDTRSRAALVHRPTWDVGQRHRRALSERNKSDRAHIQGRPLAEPLFQLRFDPSDGVFREPDPPRKAACLLQPPDRGPAQSEPPPQFRPSNVSHGNRGVW